MYRSIRLVIYVFVCILCQSTLTTTSRIVVLMRPSLSDQCRNGVQYTGLGCFTLDPPFTNTDWLPQTPVSIGLRFLLYTRNNPAMPDILSATNRSSINLSNIRPQLPVKFIIHGYLQNAGMEYIVNMTNALLNKAPMNVIVVSWGAGAYFPYARAVANTRVVGAATAQLITTLQRLKGITAQQIHIIGHSLGAHIGGYVGALIPNVRRITGLDPAQPSFSGFNETVRLDRTDARLVDVIHTDALPFETVRGYGIIEPIGHIDFYPNGGHHQPGCHEESSLLDFIEDAYSNGVTTAEISLSCSHERSTQLFISSIILSSPASSCTFQSFPCSSEESFLRGECLNCGNHKCPIMGYEADRSSRSTGVYYLNTTGTSLFCGQHYFVALTLGRNMTYVDGTLSIRLKGVTGRWLNWSTVKEGRISGADRLTSLLVDNIDIGEINQVYVRFVSRMNYLPWRRTRFHINTVEVDNIMRFPKKHFCRSNMVGPDGFDVSFTSGTYISSECP
uniref:Lipase domain-containing protein n=1 Tax=Arion vulgaris TaxID=1028688 RepID=A0A0B7AM58_9EUPU